jgi:hypothetical protein
MSHGGRTARGLLLLAAALVLMVPASAGAQGSTPPETAITDGPPDGSAWGPHGWTSSSTSGSGTLITTTRVFWFASDHPDATFECRIQRQEAPGTWTEWGACDEGGGGPFYRWDDLSVSGPARFSVRAVAAGEPDPSPAERGFTVDVDPPDTTITGGPPANVLFAPAYAPPFTFVSSEPASTFVCRLFLSDAPGDYVVIPESDCVSPLDAGIAFFAHGLPSARFVVWAVDAVGNADPTPATLPLLVDSQSPTKGFHSEPRGPISDDTPTFDWWVDDPEATVTCRIDSEPFEPCESPATYGPLRDGYHAFQIRAVDPLGNGQGGRAELAVVIVDTRVAGPEVQLDRQSSARPVVTGKAGAKERTNAKMRAAVKVGGESYRLQSRKAGIPAKERRRLVAVPRSEADGRELQAALASGERASVRTVTRFKDRLGNTAKKTRRTQLRLR